jgi:hypothetical protein
MTEQASHDTRTDSATALLVERGLTLCMRQGINPALLFMESVGVPRTVALRVLRSPKYVRHGTLDDI